MLSTTRWLHALLLLRLSSVPLPSILGKRRRFHVNTSKGLKSMKSMKITTWDRTIIFLPVTYPETCGEQIVVPHKKRSVLASNGLIGKIHLESNWDEEELFGEVRSVFKDAMGGDMNFPFTFLVPMGGGLKSLTKPVQSTSYKWTAKEVAGRADSTVYILAEKAMNSGVVDVVKGVSHSQPCCRGRNWEIDASIYQLVSHDQTQFCTKGRRLGHGYRAVCTNDSVIFIALYCHVPDPISCCKM